MNRQEALDKLKKITNKIIAIEWATGFGKTIASIKKAHSLNPKTILVICDQITHIDNWKKDLKKHGFEHLNVVYICYASIHKLKGLSYDVIIADEAHHISDKRFESFKKIKFKYALLLSATLGKEVKEKFEREYGNEFTSFKIDTKKAIQSGVLSEPSIFVEYVYLDTKSKKHIFEMKKGKKTKDTPVLTCDYEDRWNLINKYKSVVLKVSCTAKEYYTALSDKVDYYKKKHYMINESWTNNLWMQAATKRKRWLADYKTNAAIKAIKTLNKNGSNKIVSFCGSISQAEYLKNSSTIGKAVSINSKTKDYFKELDSFNKESVAQLYAVGMFRENANLNNIDAGLCIQLDSKARSFIQMLGRAMRSDSPVFYILVVKDTQDETYAENVLVSVDQKHIKYIDEHANK